MAHRHTLRILSLCTILLLPLCDARAQGFVAITGRNHPELTWRVAETPHFRIMYPEHLAGIETEAAPIAEQTYEALSRNLGVTFQERIRIYLSDEDEITNGFASRLGDGWTNIWVHAGDPDGWTGPESWLRRVLAHEIAHIFHYRAVRSNLGLFDILFSSPLPRFWTEGLAQYQTERWDTFRGDMWLRTAVLEDKLSYRDGRSVWNGRLLYAVGNSQVRFLASTYGDTTLTRILRHRRPALFGLGRVHDFEDAFRSVTGESYRDFYEQWRRHVNIYYNTIAGQRQSVDSLASKRIEYPGHYVYDARDLSDGRRLILYLESVNRPVRRLAIIDSTAGSPHVLADGMITAPVSATRDGRLVAFARRGRAEHGSLLYDVHVVDALTGHRRQLTEGGRATSPSLSPDGSRIAYVVNERGASSIRLHDLETDSVTVLSEAVPSRQVTHLRWHPHEGRLAYYVFDEHGQRRIETIDIRSRHVVRITDGRHDDRAPVWSPDGSSLGFTSLRDDVPNIFAVDLAGLRERRVTSLATGATLTDWVPDADSGRGTLIAIVTRSKEADRLYALDAAQTAHARTVPVDSGYIAWTRQTPPSVIPPRIAPDPELVRKRYRYNTWKNISHVASIGLPYFNSTADWGIGGGTLWLEPLGKHVIGALGGLSIADPDQSFFAFSYINNQFRPSLALTASRLPDVVQPYGEDILRQDFRNVSLAALLPLDWRPRPYTSTQLVMWAEHLSVTPLNASDFADRADGLPVPEAGRQTSLRLTLRRTSLRPFRDNQTHPLDGWGIRARLTGAVRNEDFGRGYLRFESSGYAILPALERHRLYLHARYRGQSGTSLAQDFVGLSRYDAIRIDAGGLLRWVSSESDRVRGHRRVVVGSNVLFGSAEYRIPLVPSLETQVLGIVSLGSTSLSPFFDAGTVWSRPNEREAVAQYGAGLEVKNTLQLLGLIEVTHAVGFAQPVSHLFSNETYEVYYRIQSALPF